jgi:hypothetical protein
LFQETKSSRQPNNAVGIYFKADKIMGRGKTRIERDKRIDKNRTGQEKRKEKRKTGWQRDAGRIEAEPKHTYIVVWTKGEHNFGVYIPTPKPPFNQIVDRPESRCQCMYP